MTFRVFFDILKYMAEVLTIPKKLIKKGELVIVPRIDFEKMLRIQKRLLWEEQDTDAAIRIFEREKKEGKLRRASKFSEILR